jgi:DNA mismatch repair protein MutL
MWGSGDFTLIDQTFDPEYRNHQEPDVEGGTKTLDLTAWRGLAGGFHKGPAFSFDRLERPAYGRKFEFVEPPKGPGPVLQVPPVLPALPVLNQLEGSRVEANLPRGKVSRPEAERPEGETGTHVQSQPIPGQDQIHHARPGKYLDVGGGFIVGRTEEGFIVIDQHALHERLIYEKLRQRLRRGKLESQKLLVPVTVEVSDSEAETLTARSAVLEKLGLEVGPFGPGTWAVHSFPALPWRPGDEIEPGRFARDVIDLLDSAEANCPEDLLLEKLLSSAACKAAVKADSRLNEQEIEQLLIDARSCGMPGRCPHGRPAIIEFSRADLARQFERK